MRRPHQVGGDRSALSLDASRHEHAEAGSWINSHRRYPRRGAVAPRDGGQRPGALAPRRVFWLVPATGATLVTAAGRPDAAVAVAFVLAVSGRDLCDRQDARLSGRLASQRLVSMGVHLG